MRGSSFNRLGAASGIVFVVLEVVGIQLGPTGSPNQSKTDIGRAFLGGLPSGRSLLGQYLFLLSFLFFVVFAARVWADLRRGEGEYGWLSATALVGAVMFGALEVAGTASFSAVRLRAGHGLDLQEAAALADLGNAMFIAGVSGAGLFLAAAAAVILRTRALASWIGWSAAVIALGLFLITEAVPGDIAMVPALLFELWVVVVAVVLIRRSDIPRPAER